MLLLLLLMLLLGLLLLQCITDSLLPCFSQLLGCQGGGVEGQQLLRDHHLGEHIAGGSVWCGVVWCVMHRSEGEKGLIPSTLQ